MPGIDPRLMTSRQKVYSLYYYRGLEKSFVSDGNLGESVQETNDEEHSRNGAIDRSYASHTLKICFTGTCNFWREVYVEFIVFIIH